MFRWSTATQSSLVPRSRDRPAKLRPSASSPAASNSFPGDPLRVTPSRLRYPMWARSAPGKRIWRTTRALTMAPRSRAWSIRDAARLAARPRPNLLLRLPEPRERPPAFCAAWSACARNGFVRGPCVEPIRPGRTRKSSLRPINPSVECQKMSANGALSKRVSCKRRSQCLRKVQIWRCSSPNRPSAPCGFYPAVTSSLSLPYRLTVVTVLNPARPFDDVFSLHVAG